MPLTFVGLRILRSLRAILVHEVMVLLLLVPLVILLL